MKIKNCNVFALLVATLLASCQTSLIDTNAPVVAPAPVGIDGEWVDTRGINSAKFGGGTFTSIDATTGQTMARGSYTFTDPQNVNLAFTSLIRKTSVNAACILVAQSQLNCTTSSGAKFILVRRAVAPGATAVAPTKQKLPPNVPADAVLIGES